MSVTIISDSFVEVVDDESLGDWAKALKVNVPPYKGMYYIYIHPSQLKDLKNMILAESDFPETKESEVFTVTRLY